MFHPGLLMHLAPPFRQLPELLGLIGATTGEVSKISSAVAGTSEFQELSKSASEAAKKATKPVADAAALEKVKKLVADEKGEVCNRCPCA